MKITRTPVESVGIVRANYTKKILSDPQFNFIYDDMRPLILGS